MPVSPHQLRFVKEYTLYRFFCTKKVIPKNSQLEDKRRRGIYNRWAVSEERDTTVSVYRFWFSVSDVGHLVKLMNTEKDHQIAEIESKHARQRLHFQLPIQRKHIRTENTQINIISHGLTSSTSLWDPLDREREKGQKHPKKRSGCLCLLFLKST